MSNRSDTSNYLQAFVEGVGIRFHDSKTNHEAKSQAQVKWAEIASSLRISDESIILFCGAKNNGKSSLVRYLTNKFNHEYNSNHKKTAPSDRGVYYVDFDPGQPEMTTPGVVSSHLIKSDKPKLQCPTYLNTFQHEQIAASSVGGTNMSVNPRIYIDNCRYVFDKVKEHISASDRRMPIFINTMGFVRSVGLPMLMDLIKICQPTNLIVLNIENNPMRTIYADLSPSSISQSQASFFYESWRTPAKLDYQYDLHDLQFTHNDSSSIAASNRVALQMAYLSSISEALYTPVMKVEPKWIDLSSVSIYCVSSYPLKPAIVLELLIHSWIHLVKLKARVTKQAQVELVEDEICQLIDNVAENDILGCGIVADIDIEKKRIAIITPLSQEKLDKEIDCIIKPLSIQVPREILQPTLLV